MALPRITAPTETTISELPTSYPELFLSDFRFRGRPNTAWRLSADFSPYNYDSNVLAPNGKPQRLACDIREKAMQYPATVGPALATVISVAQLLLREQQLLSIEVRTEDEEAELKQVQASLTGE